ncbi:MAG: DNA mismatch repair protein MutS [Nitrosomonas sp.]|nr:DNA mismatch repair protein MutS [Nitrosomonas sp.]
MMAFCKPEQHLSPSSDAQPSSEASIWRENFILSPRARQAQAHDTRPAPEDYGAVDTRTFAAIEADALFAEMDHTKTHTGKCVLYRSLARPAMDAGMLQTKQEALREIAANPVLHQKLEQYLVAMAANESSLYYFLYGEFMGGLTTDNPHERNDKLEFGGYGYRQFVDATLFAVDLTKDAQELPMPESRYLRELVQTLREFGTSRTCALMRGPVYVLNGKFLTKDEKPRFRPVARFRPSIFKWFPMTIMLSIVLGVLYFFHAMLVELGASYIGYGLLVLVVPIVPIIVQAVSASDRDGIMYPLQKIFRKSNELAKAMEALGMLDELLALHGHAHASSGSMVLPDITADSHHRLTASDARNPLLARTQPDYVPNDVSLDATHRLLIVTGPNSGGKTAYCKTVAQIQLLGQAGAYVPATKASLVPVEHLYYQIPDPGQLDEGMGRFAHELKQTREIFFNSTPRSLVILDELAEGTTFEEKMTLSEYVLKGFHQLGATTILVTHNHELCERLQKDSIGDYLQVEFSEQGPTHRLIPGVSHISHADRIASALGFSKEDVEKHLASLGE